MDDKIFYKKIIAIGIPVVIQNIISIGLNLIDTLMVGLVGEEQLAAVGAANQIYFIFATACFGLYSGAAVYTAQYWGAKDIKGVKKLLGIDYLVGGTLAISVCIVAFVFSPQLISFFSRDSTVIGYGVQYMRIACFSYIFAGLSFAITYNSRSIQKPIIPTVINAVALGLNTILNYALIYGHFGFSPQGVRGAAIATLIARAFELIVMLIFVYSHRDHPFNAKIKELTAFSKVLFKKVMKTAIPVVFSEGVWSLSVALIFVAYGMLGTSAFAVSQVASVVSELLQAFYFGVGNATAAIIGETLGQGDKDRAYRYAGKSINITRGLNVIITITMILLSKSVANIYNFNEETTVLLVAAIMAMAVTTTPKMISYMYIVGILRAGGDTSFCMKIELICDLFIQIPLAFFAVLVLKITLPWAMIVVASGELIKLFFTWRRYKSKEWINIVT